MMATFGGTSTDVHSNEIVNNSFYNNSEVHGYVHFPQNTDCAPDPRQNFQNYPVPLPAPLPHPPPHASYPFPDGPYPGFESGLAPSCPQWVEQKSSSNADHPSATKTQDGLQGYPPYHNRFAEPQNSSSLPAPVLPLRFSASRENFPRGSEQQSTSPSNNNNNNNGNSNNNNGNNNNSFQLQYPVPSFQGVTDQYGYGHHYMSMPHPYARPPPQSPYHPHHHQHPTGWTTPLPLCQDQSPATTTTTTTTTEGPYLQNNHLSLLRVSPSMYYSQDFAASHPNAAPVRFRTSVEYPETSGWSRKEDGEGEGKEKEEKKEQEEGKRQLKIPANSARKIVYGLHPLPPQMLIQARSAPSSSSSSLPSSATMTDLQAQPKTTNATMPVPNGTQYMPVPNGTQYMSVPNGTPYMLAPNGTPYMPVPNGTPYMPVPNGTPYMPVPNGTPCLPPSLATINEDVSGRGHQEGQEPAGGGAVADASDSGAGEAVKGTDAGSEKALEDGPMINFTQAKVLSCLVIVFCGGLLWGVLGFIFAAEGQVRYRKGDREKALKLKGLSYLMSVVGIVCGLLAAIIVGVLYGVYYPV